jgi:hypothetical protein
MKFSRVSLSWQIACDEIINQKLLETNNLFEFMQNLMICQRFDDSIPKKFKIQIDNANKYIKLEKNYNFNFPEIFFIILYYHNILPLYHIELCNATQIENSILNKEIAIPLIITKRKFSNPPRYFRLTKKSDIEYCKKNYLNTDINISILYWNYSENKYIFDIGLDNYCECCYFDYDTIKSLSIKIDRVSQLESYNENNIIDQSLDQIILGKIFKHCQFDMLFEYSFNTDYDEYYEEWLFSNYRSSKDIQYEHALNIMELNNWDYL